MVEKGRNGFPSRTCHRAAHARATQWSVMSQSFIGSKVVLVDKFDPAATWRLVGAERVNTVMVTGDAMAKPLVEVLDEPGHGFDLSSLLAVVSSAACSRRR